MEYLEKTFRWFGADFGVSLDDIKQTGANGVVTALYKILTGEVWFFESIKALKEEIESADLTWSVVESVNVHESIKTRSEGFQDYTKKYIQTIFRLSLSGKHLCWHCAFQPGV